MDAGIGQHVVVVELLLYAIGYWCLEVVSLWSALLEGVRLYGVTRSIAGDPHPRIDATILAVRIAP